MNIKLVLFVFASAIIQTWACSRCGLPTGAPVEQFLSRRFIFIDSLNWILPTEILQFVDRLNATVNTYSPHTGQTVSQKVKELEGVELAAFYPVKQPIQKEPKTFQSLIAANQSLYLMEGEFKGGYTLDFIMDIAEESQIISKVIVTPEGDLIVGTKPTGYASKDYTKGAAKYYHVKLSDKSKKVIDEGYDITGGACFNKYRSKFYTTDSGKNKIYCFDYKDGSATNKKEIFDLADFNQVSKENITGHILAILLNTEGDMMVGLSKGHQMLVFCPYLKKVVKIEPLASNSQTDFMYGGFHGDILFIGTASRYNKPGQGSLQAIFGTGARGWLNNRVKVN